MTPFRRPVPRLHIVTDDEVLARSGFLTAAAAVLGARTPVALHLRGPGTAARVLLDLALRLRPVADEEGAVLLVNDRIDVALAAALDGVHLAGRSLPVRTARSLLPPDALVGASVHGAEAAGRAAAEGVDYLIVGTIFPTPSHAGRPAAGTVSLTRIAAEVDRPLIGIGGVTPERVGACLGHGAWGVAVLRGVWNATDPAGAVEGYLDRMTPEETGTEGGKACE